MRLRDLQAFPREIWNLFSLLSPVDCRWDCFHRLAIINLANLIFGAWILAGGALTAHLCSKTASDPASAMATVLEGTQAGFFGAVVSTIMLIPEAKLVFAADWETVRQQAGTAIGQDTRNRRPPCGSPSRAMSAQEVSFHY